MTGALGPVLISDDYRRLNAEKHLEKKGYGALAWHLAPVIKTICANNGFGSILDYGCGKGNV
jgi:hypothetical protein